MLLVRRVGRVGSYAPAVATCGALLSACFALLGYSMLGFLFASRYYAPASSHYVRPLHFDYTGYVAVAYAPLSPEVAKQPAPRKGHPPPTGAVLPKSRFLPSGTQVGVYVRLLIPADHTDLFQVTGELLSNTTHVAARSVRTHINTPQPTAYRLAKHMLFLPLHVIGLGHGDWVTVDLPLFDVFEEREDEPVAIFRARLASRNASRGGLPPPPVYRAELHVRLRLGPLQTVLFWLRPGFLTGWALLIVGAGASVGGSIGTLVLLALAFVLRRWAASSAAAAKQAGGRRRSGAALTGAPRRKHDFGPPYGDADRAMIYSLEHAQIYRSASEAGDNGHVPSVEEYGAEDDLSYGQRPYGSGFSRQASAIAQTASPPPAAAPAVDVAYDKSPGWSGSTSGGSAFAPTPVATGRAGSDGAGYLPPSRQTSGAAPTPSEPAAAAAAALPNGNWAPPLQATESCCSGGDVNAHSDLRRDSGQGEEGNSKGQSEVEEESGGEGTQTDEGDGEEVDRGAATPGKIPLPTEARRGEDVEPEADSGTVRKRSGFAWQA